MDKPRELYGLVDMLKTGLKTLPFLSAIRKWSKVSIQDFAARFSDPFLRQALPLIADIPAFPMFAVLVVRAFIHNRNAGYLIGGSLKFSLAIERCYRNLGGEVHYRSQVEKVLVNNGRTVGVCLASGAEHHADIVISAADGHATIFDMLGGKYSSDEIRSYYGELPIFQPYIQVSLGVTHDFSNEPHLITYPLDTPVTIAGEERTRMGVKHYCCDPTLAPAGKSVLVVMFGANYEYWKYVYEDRERYEAEQQQIANTVIAQLEQRFPGLTEQIEVVDVATPMTYEHYTGNRQGSPEGWMFTTKMMGTLMGEGMRKTHSLA